ncbi:RxLR effector protein [Phytophthora megakarya]|uniref:RxLR effector protein n=1 Tax=Phytophthora megakarya TaxID=4795 RepID=A0A225WFZ5_9STRA|nr:RxLR effector protein [Phytophthora megakarya]
MRFSAFIALLITNFITCSPSFGTAEKVANAVEVRRLLSIVIKGGNTLVYQLLKLEAFEKSMVANGNETAVKAAINMVANYPKVSKPQVKFVPEAMVQGAPRFKMFVKITLGPSVGALAIYGAYKLMTKEAAAAVDAATTTRSA